MQDYSMDEISNPLALEIASRTGRVYQGDLSRWEPLLLGLFGSLHVLMEDLPGVGKTTLAKTLAGILNLDFGRIQFTPDLLPGDVIGTTVWSLEKKDFYFRPGAVMHEFLLADEINRASARTQSALLEAMQEYQVTVDGATHPLPEPFFVAATQNPVSFQGTFSLPEAQLDRFGLVFSLGYPTSEESFRILDLPVQGFRTPPEPLKEGKRLLLEHRRRTGEIECRDSLKNWAINLVHLTRTDHRIALGISPRGLQQWIQASRASALLRDRGFVLPEDLLHTLKWTLAHRLILTPGARLEGLKPGDLLDTLASSRPLPLK